MMTSSQEWDSAEAAINLSSRIKCRDRKMEEMRCQREKNRKAFTVDKGAKERNRGGNGEK